MGWSKFDDRRHTNDKLLAAGIDNPMRGLAANGLDANAITYCSANETDGFVKESALIVLAPGLPKGQRDDLTTRLVKVGRWSRDDDRGGWWVHDFLDYHTEHIELEKKREADRQRKAAQKRGSDGQFQAESGGNPDGGREDSNDLPTVPNPIPIQSDPDPESDLVVSSTSDLRPADESPDDRRRVELALEAITDRHIADLAKGPISKPAAYRRAVRAGVDRDFKPRAYLLAHQHPDWPPERLAVTLDPPDKPKLAVVATENTRLGGISQWLAEGTGA